MQHAPGTNEPATIERLRAETLERMQDAGINLEASGAVLYSGWSTLRAGSLYIMGLNPGGGASDHRSHTIRKSIIERGWHYSAYVNECWGTSSVGKSIHQRRVQSLCCHSWHQPSQVFAANAIFYRSSDSTTLNYSMWRNCWIIHQWFLSIVRPKVVFCLGNGQVWSPFGFLAQVAKPCVIQEIGSGFRDGRVFRGRLVPEQEFECTVIGVPHPSRFPVSSPLEAFIKGLGISPH
jgi:hypothetical protein